MRIVLISDTHEQQDRITVPDGDLLIHAGDFTWDGKIAAISKFNYWMESLPHKYKVVVAGNHDLLFESQPDLARSLLGNEIIYLEDSSHKLPNGIKLWGSPRTPRFGHGWAFNYKKNGKESEELFGSIPEGTDIVVTHSPPRNVLDKVPMPKGTELDYCEYADIAGDLNLARRVKKIKPRLHVFGHIHEDYGHVDINGTTYVNASIFRNRSNVMNEPIIIDWKNV